MLLPQLPFLPTQIDRYLDLPFRLPGSGWAWLAGIVVACLQIWFSWLFIVIFIAFVLIMILPVPLPLYSLSALTATNGNDRPLYFIALKRLKTDEKMVIDVVKIGITNASIFIGVFSVITSFVIVWLFGWQGHDILLAGRPYWPQFVVSEETYDLALYYYATPYGIDADWPVTWYQLARWIYPIGVVWCFVIFLLYREELLSIKRDLDANSQHRNALFGLKASARKKHKNRRVLAILTVLLGVPLAIFVIGGQIFMLAYPH